MPKRSEIAGITIERSTKKSGYLAVAKMANGSDLRIAVHITAGAKPGPTLCLLATEHGDETLGMDIIWRILREIEPKDLSGQIVALPVVNPLSFEAQTYHTPQDMRNLHVLFPGDIEGSLTEKMAAILTKEIIDNADCIINLHGAGPHLVNEFTYVPDLPGKVGKETIELAKVFGQRILFLAPSNPGFCISYAAETRGVPGIIPEIGSDLNWAPDVAKFVEIGVRGVKNVLKHLGMISGKPERPAEEQILLKRRKTFKARHGGMFYPEFGLEDLGKILPKGTTLGKILDPQSFEELEKIMTPYKEGILFMIRGRGRVHPGDYMFHVGDMETKEIV